MLVIPQSAVVQLGAGDPAVDAATEQRLAASAPPLAIQPAGDWRLIQGELVTFDDIAQRLPLLDALEDFCPPGECLYHRVLTWTHQPQTLAWVYVAPHGVLPAGAVPTGDCWSR